jgi:hypothetical protein
MESACSTCVLITVIESDNGDTRDPRATEQHNILLWNGPAFVFGGHVPNWHVHAAISYRSAILTESGIAYLFHDTAVGSCPLLQ